MKRKIIVAITGSSGALYAKILLDKFREMKEQLDEVAVIFSTKARDFWKYELGEIPELVFPFHVYEKDDFYAPFSSGSSFFDTMIICPCSTGTLGRIANGISHNLITRAAEVMLKEHRKLILVPRETPFSLIHLENMTKVTQSGGIICPAIPSFYNKPETLEQLAETVIDRVLHLAGFETNGLQWGKTISE